MKTDFSLSLFNEYKNFLNTFSGLLFTDDKNNFIQQAVYKRMKDTTINTPQEYLNLLKHETNETNEKPMSFQN